MTPRPTAPPTLVIGLGNRDRGDDAVGLVVAERLAARHPDAHVRTHEGADVDLIDLWGGVDRVVVVDAARTGDPVGFIRSFDVDDPALDALHTGGSHAFGLPAVIALARVLGRLPARLELHVVAVAADPPAGDAPRSTFTATGHGAALSSAAERAVGVLVDRLSGQLGAAATPS